MHQLSRLVRLACAAVRPYHHDLGVGNGLAHGAGPPIDLARRQIGGAKCLGEAVHQKHLGAGQRIAELLQCRARHGTTGIRDVTQVPGDRSGPAQVRELRPERRHASEAGNPIAREERKNVAGEQIVHQRNARADVECGRQLAEAVVEAEGQDRKQSILGYILEVARDAMCTGHHVPVRQHDPFRLAGAAGGVEDRYHVRIDHAMQRRARRIGDEFVPSMTGKSPARGNSVVAPGEHEMSEIRTVAQFLLEHGGPLGRSDEHAHVAVTENVSDLCGLQERIDRHEYATCAGGTEHRDDCLRHLGQEDRDAFELPGRETPDRCCGKVLDCTGEPRVVDDGVLVGEGPRARSPFGRAEWQLKQQLTHAIVAFSRCLTPLRAPAAC